MQFTPNSVLSEVTICNNNINKIMKDLNSFFNQKSMVCHMICEELWLILNGQKTVVLLYFVCLHLQKSQVSHLQRHHHVRHKVDISFA